MGIINRYTAGTAFAAALALTPKLLGDVEGTSYSPYIDIAGVPTVCEGITGPDVVMGKKYSRQECDNLLYKHIAVAKKAVDDSVKVKIPDTMRASLYSFTYNVGGGAFRSSTMLKLINKGQLLKACDQLFVWEKFTDPKTKKKVHSKGLHNRRLVEFSYCVKDLK
jgi:lysozyme